MLASEIIRRVREIQVRTGRHVADVLAGEYVSVFKGGGIEFEEVRPYVPGDDVRTIDWNVTARTGEAFVKRYVEERQLTLMVVADVSASQDYGSAERSKREAAAELCALLAFSAIRNDDNVGLVLFHGEIEQYIPPRKGQKHALRIVREVLAHGELDDPNNGDANNGKTVSPRAFSQKTKRSQATKESEVPGQPAQAAPDLPNIVDEARARKSIGTGAQGGLLSKTRLGLRRILQRWEVGSSERGARFSTNIAGAMEFVMGVSRRRSVCFVISDFLDDDFERALLTANRRHDVIAVLITDPCELELPSLGMVALSDAESGRTELYDTGSAAFRTEAARLEAQRVQSLEKRLRSMGIDFIHIDAAGSVIDPLVRFFHMRTRRQRR
jgi:uncharacterized protein (DUF58 family)